MTRTTGPRLVDDPRDAPHYFVTDARRTEFVPGQGYQYDEIALRRQRCQTCGGRPDDPVHDHARVRAYWSEASG